MARIGKQVSSNRFRTLEDLVWVEVARAESKVDANKKQKEVHQPPHACRIHLARQVLGSFIVLYECKLQLLLARLILDLGGRNGE